MAEQRPLCLVAGVVTVLPAGDTLPGAGGGGLSWTQFASRNTTQTTVTASVAVQTQALGTIPANTLQVGDRIMVTSRYRLTNGTTASNMVVQLFIGGVARATVTTALGTTATTNRTFEAVFDLVVDTAGAAGTASVATLSRTLTAITSSAPTASGLTAIGSTLADNAVEIRWNISAATATAGTHQRSDIELVR